MIIEESFPVPMSLYQVKRFIELGNQIFSSSSVEVKFSEYTSDCQQMIQITLEGIYQDNGI